MFCFFLSVRGQKGNCFFVVSLQEPLLQRRTKSSTAWCFPSGDTNPFLCRSVPHYSWSDERRHELAFARGLFLTITLLQQQQQVDVCVLSAAVMTKASAQADTNPAASRFMFQKLS